MKKGHAQMRLIFSKGSCCQNRFRFFSLCAASQSKTKDEPQPMSGKVSITSRLTRCFGEEWLDNFLYIRAPAFRALRLLSFVLLDSQRFAEFLIALLANVFVEGHTVTSGYWFTGSAKTKIFPSAIPFFPHLIRIG
jgi:hypothetical protein